MKMLTKNKGVLISIGIFILVIFFYNTFFRSEIVSVSSDELSATSIGDDLIKTSEELQAVTLDHTLFSSTGYLLLVDFSTAIEEQATGRPNPFNDIGQD